jgi:hypothetical protein
MLKKNYSLSYIDLVYDKNNYRLFAVDSLCVRKNDRKPGIGERMRVDSDKDISER